MRSLIPNLFLPPIHCIDGRILSGQIRAEGGGNLYLSFVAIEIVPFQSATGVGNEQRYTVKWHNVEQYGEHHHRHNRSTSQTVAPNRRVIHGIEEGREAVDRD